MKTCTKCRAEKEDSFFAWRIKSRGLRRAMCMACVNKGEHQRRLNTPGYAAKRHSEYVENRDRVYLQHLLRKYNLTAEELESLIRFQNNLCAACGLPPSGRGLNSKLHVDHDHDTGRVRALLCGDCNKSLGMLKESPERCMALAVYANKNCRTRFTINTTTLNTGD
jgi:hypothetical protein